jgi:uncharacterized protein (TIGR02466 family)
MIFNEITPFTNSLYQFLDVGVDIDELNRSIEQRLETHIDWIKRGDNRFKTPDCHLITSEFQDLFNKISPIACDIIKSWGITAPVGLKRYWIQVDHNDGYAHAHSHTNCLLSGVFYSSMPEGAGNIVFERPDPQEYYFKGYDTTPYSFKNYWIKPEENMALFFPSYIRHRVDFHKFTTNKKRIAIAYDYGFL